MDAVLQKLEWVERRNAERHADLSSRLDRIEVHSREIERQALTTNGRVTRHDEQIRTLFERVKAIGRQAAGGDLELIKRLRWYVAVFVLGGGAVLTVLRIAGLLR